MTMGEIQKGDIIQMEMDDPNDAWGGCLFIVDEVRDWGVTCYAPSPQGTIHYRAANGKFTKVGSAVWVEGDGE